MQTISVSRAATESCSFRTARSVSCVTFVLGLILTAAAAATPAAVIDATADGFVVQNEVAIQASPEKVYAALIQVARWWNPQHTYSGRSANLSIDPRPGGCFCERLASGGGAEHMRVVNVQPNKVLRLVGALGPLQGSGLAGSLTWTLTPSSAGTTLRLAYSVGGYMQGGLDKVAPAVDQVLGDQIGRLKRSVEGKGLD
jgi:uncharacterized protein YndB with AHSA1/START domain